MSVASSALRALILLPCGFTALSSVAALAQPVPEGPRLRDLADRRDFLIGAALGDNFTSSGMGASTYAAYTTVAGREFNFFTAENAHKFGRIQPSLANFQWSVGDRYDSFARSVGAAFHGHAFVWYKTTSTPPFIVATTDRDELLGLMREHINAVGTRYGPGTIVWDVVNESLQSSVAIAPTTDWRTALRPADTDHWRAVIGTDYVEQAFRFAATTRAATGQTYRLIYNDFTNESLTNKSLAQYMMAQDFLARGVPLEGIGFQMHVGTGTPAYNSIRTNFKRLSDLGLDLYITEFDTITGSSPAELDRQAAIYHRTLDVALRNPHFRAFQTWGFTDRTSWLYSWEGNPLGADVRPLPFTTDFAPKPAYYAIQDALAYEQRAPAVVNGDFEAATLAPWFAHADPAAALTLGSNRPRSGASSLAVRSRSAADGGVAQDILAALNSPGGGAGRHHLAAWFRVPAGPTPVRLRILLTDTAGGLRDFTVEGVTGASWHRIEGWVNLTWNRALVSATLHAETPGSTADFDLDAVTLGDGNLLANSTMEDPLANWTTLGSPTLSSETSQARRHYGDRGLRAANRGAFWQGPAQDVRAALLASGPGVYEISGYMKSAAAGDNGKLTVRLGAPGAHIHHSVARTVGPDAWTRLSGTISLDWPADAPPASALFYAETSAGTAALDLDDVLLRKLTATAVPPFAAWLALHLDETQLADPTLAAPDAAPLGEDVPNLLKFALGLPVATPADSASLPRLHAASAEDGGLRFEYSRPAGSPVLVGVETSDDLHTWEPLVVAPVLGPGDTPGQERVQLPLPTPAAPAFPSSAMRVFYRLRFSLP